MASITQSLHNQYPTSAMTDAEYEAAMAVLTEQVAAALGDDYPEGEAPKAASDALAFTFGASEDQTVWDWTTAACRRIGADINQIDGL